MLVKLDHLPRVRGENKKSLSCHHPVLLLGISMSHSNCSVCACIDFEVSILGGLFHPTSTSTDVRLDEALEETRGSSCSRYTKRENPVDKKNHPSSTYNILSILVYSSYQ